MAAAAQFMTNSDTSVDANKPAFQQSVWSQDDPKDQYQGNQLSWNQTGAYSDSSCGPSHTISYYAYGGSQSGYGSSVQPDTTTSWWYGNSDPATAVGFQEADQLSWEGYGAGYYPVMADFRGGGFGGGTDVDMTSPWSGLALSMDAGYWTSGSPWIMPKYYQPSGEPVAYAGHCVKEEADERDVIQQVDGPAAISASYVQVQVGLTGL